MRKLYRSIRSETRRLARLAVPGLAAAFILTPPACAATAEGGMFGPGETFFAAAPIADAELADLRGGFVLPNGIIIDISLRFTTALNGGTPLTTDFNFDSLIGQGHTGVQHNVKVEEGQGGGPPTLEVDTIPTSALAGIQNNLQNNASGITLDNVTSLSIKVQNGDFGSFQVHGGGPQFNPSSLIGIW